MAKYTIRHVVTASWKSRVIFCVKEPDHSIAISAKKCHFYRSMRRVPFRLVVAHWRRASGYKRWTRNVQPLPRGESNDVFKHAGARPKVSSQTTAISLFSLSRGVSPPEARRVLTWRCHYLRYAAEQGLKHLARQTSLISCRPSHRTSTSNKHTCLQSLATS